MYLIRTTIKGQVTLPVEMRRRLGLQTGDVLEVRETPDGYLVQKHASESPFDRYAGCLSQKDQLSTDNLLAELRGLE